MSYRFEQLWRELVLGERKGLVAAIARAALLVVSWPCRTIVRLRNWAIDKEWLSTHHVQGALVVSVGNLVVGGTGKTPVLIKIAEELPNIKLAVLSRGYRSPAETQSVPTFLSRGEGPLHPPDFCGDEPFLISARLPHVLVVVGRNRRVGASMATEAGCKLLLLDDGMQHRRLARDLEVVVIDAEDPFGQGYHFPRGFLREDKHSLSRAQLVVLNHVRSPAHFSMVAQEVQPYTDAPMVGTELQFAGVETLEGVNIPTLMGKKVGIFCGIGKPEKFRNTIHGLGGEIVAEMFSPDHRLPAPTLFKRFAQRCYDQGAELLVCTEKDKVKLDTSLESVLPIAWVKVGIHIVAGFEAWDAFIEGINNRTL